MTQIAQATAAVLAFVAAAAIGAAPIALAMWAMHNAVAGSVLAPGLADVAFVDIYGVSCCGALCVLALAAKEAE